MSLSSTSPEAPSTGGRPTFPASNDKHCSWDSLSGHCLSSVCTHRPVYPAPSGLQVGPCMGQFQEEPNSAHLTPIPPKEPGCTTAFPWPGGWPCPAPGPLWSASQGLNPGSTSCSPAQECVIQIGHSLWTSCRPMASHSIRWGRGGENRQSMSMLSRVPQQEGGE